MSDEDFWKEIQLPTAMLAAVDQHDADIRMRLDESLDTLRQVKKIGKLVPPAFMSVNLIKGLGLDPTELDNPIVMMGFTYIYALYKLLEEEDK